MSTMAGRILSMESGGSAAMAAMKSENPFDLRDSFKGKFPTGAGNHPFPTADPVPF
jgi:hypothetical protein